MGAVSNMDAEGVAAEVLVIAPSVQLTGFDDPQVTEIDIPNGTITVVRDKWCPSDKAYFIDWFSLENWTRGLHNQMIREKLHG
jgi:hypothetical protein